MRPGRATFIYWSDEALDFPHFLPRQMSLPCCVWAEYSLIRVQFRRKPQELRGRTIAAGSEIAFETVAFDLGDGVALAVEKPCSDVNLVDAAIADVLQGAAVFVQRDMGKRGSVTPLRSSSASLA